MRKRAADLCGSAGGVDQAHCPLPDIRSLQGTDEELIVGLVDGVAALEGQHVLASGQRGPNISRRGTWENPFGQFQPLYLAPCCTHAHAHTQALWSNAKGCKMQSSTLMWAEYTSDIWTLSSRDTAQYRRYTAVVPYCRYFLASLCTFW